MSSTHAFTPPTSTVAPSTASTSASATLFFNQAADAVATMLTDEPPTNDVLDSGGAGAGRDMAPGALISLDLHSHDGNTSGGRNSAQVPAIVAAVVAGAAVLLLVMVWVVKRRATAQASKATRHSLRTTMVPNRGYRYSVGSPGAVEKVERSRSSVSYGFGTFGDDIDDSTPVPRWSTVTLDDEEEDVVFEAHHPLPSVHEYPHSGRASSEHTLTIPLGTPTAGIVLEQHGAVVVVGKVVPGSPAWLVQESANRIAVGDVLLGVQAIRLGRHHNLANARAVLASQIDVAFKAGRALQLTVCRPDPYA